MTLICFDRLSIDKDKAATIFDAITRCFYEDYEEDMVTDVGNWEMLVFDDAAHADEFYGPLVTFNHIYVDGESVSDIIRKNVGRDDLFVFDGNPDQVNRVEVVYNRVTKIVPGQKPEDATWDFVTWDYKDTLIIDRKSETLEIKNRVGEGCEVTHTYYVQGGVENFLDNVYPEMLDDVKGNPADVITNPMETKTYDIKIITKHGIETSISGTYDKNGLPAAWPKFIDDLRNFIEFYGFPGEMFSERCFGKVLRRESEIIFCDVIFEEGGKTYYYIADTDEFCVGDLVVVPAGADNHQAIVRIEAINYFTENKAPFPVERAKHIIGKYDPDEDGEEYKNLTEVKNEKKYPADKDEKPEGYYDEIKYSWNKKDFLMEHFASFNPEIYTAKDKDYDYLEENECAVVVKNPDCDRNIEFEMTGEFTLFFAGWHTHYFTYEYDFSEMLRDAERIIKNELCAVVVEIDGNWMSSSLHEAFGTISKEELIKSYEEDHEDSLAARKGVAHIRFWDSSKDYDLILND